MSGYTVTFILIVLCAVLYIWRDAVVMKREMNKKKFWVHFEADDPIMLAAAERARSSLHRFDELNAKYPRFCSLALGPIGPNGDMKPVLADAKVEGGYVVRKARNVPGGYAVPEGDAFTCKTEDIVDWIVYESEKKDRIHGGYTIRAVVDIARRDGVPIPPHVLRQTERFVKD